MAQDVFVSYSQPDRARAFEIVEHLEAGGITVWIAPRDIAPSADWAAEIIEAIGACRIMVLVFSGASNDSPQVRREVERAVHRQLPILPLRVEEVLPTRSMEYFLSAQHWLDAFPPPLSRHCERLCVQVRALLAPAASAPPTGRTGEVRLASPVFTDEELAPLQSRLAEHVGPLARILVRRAASKAPDRAALIEALAVEIDAPAARRAFLDSCRAMSGVRA
jgi:hypothetical protein